MAIAKEYGKEITPEQAQALCDKLKASANGELSDEELEAVAGGGPIDVWQTATSLTYPREDRPMSGGTGQS